MLFSYIVVSLLSSCYPLLSMLLPLFRRRNRCSLFCHVILRSPRSLVIVGDGVSTRRDRRLTLSSLAKVAVSFSGVVIRFHGRFVGQKDLSLFSLSAPHSVDSTPLRASLFGTLYDGRRSSRASSMRSFFSRFSGRPGISWNRSTTGSYLNLPERRLCCVRPVVQLLALSLGLRCSCRSLPYSWLALPLCCHAFLNRVSACTVAYHCPP